MATEDQRTFDDIVTAHRAVRTFVERALSTDDSALLLPHMERMCDLLPEHFAYEEQDGGFLEQIGQTSPGGRSHVAILCAEHRRFETEVPALVRAIQAGDPSALDRVRAFAEDIREHERLEAVLGGLIQ